MCSLSRDDFGRLDSARFICWGEEGLLDGSRYLAWKGLCLCHSYILKFCTGKKRWWFRSKNEFEWSKKWCHLCQKQNMGLCIRAAGATGSRCACVCARTWPLDSTETLQSCTLAHATPPVRSPSRLSSAFLLKLAFVKPQCLTAGQTFFLQNKINSWTRRLSRLQPTMALKEQEHTEEQRAGRLALRAGMCSQEELSK